MVPLLTFAWPETVILIAVVLLLAVLVRALLVRAIGIAVNASLKGRLARVAASPTNRAEEILARAAGLSGERHQARTRTLGSVLRSLVSVVIVTIALLTILDVLGVPLAPLLTSAGIGGIALAFGAQSLVKDYLSGMLMIMEDQYGVGDLIDTGQVSGTVEEVGLRVTRVRDGSGQIWYVRNGEILRLGNRSQGWSTATVDVPIAHDEDAPRAIGVLRGVMAEVFDDPRWADVLLEEPTVAGVNEVRGQSVLLRIFAKCAPDQNWGVERDILERSVAALRDAGVRWPAPTTAPPDAAAEV